MIGSGCTGNIIKQAYITGKQECYRSNETNVNNNAQVRDHRQDPNNNSNNNSNDNKDYQCDDVRYPAYFVDGCKNSRHIKRFADASGSGKAYYADYLKD